MRSPSAANHRSRRPPGEAARVITTHPIPRQVLLVRNPGKAVFADTTIIRRDLHQQTYEHSPKRPCRRLVSLACRSSRIQTLDLNQPVLRGEGKLVLADRNAVVEQKLPILERQAERNKDLVVSTRNTGYRERTNVSVQRLPDSPSNKAYRLLRSTDHR